MITRNVHAGVAWLLVAALLIQVWLAGSAIPQLGGNGSFATHRDFGYLIGLLSLILLIVAIVAALRARAHRPGSRDPRPVCRAVVAAVHGSRIFPPPLRSTRSTPCS